MCFSSFIKFDFILQTVIGKGKEAGDEEQRKREATGIL